jgi:hypothetical protein
MGTVTSIFTATGGRRGGGGGDGIVFTLLALLRVAGRGSSAHGESDTSGENRAGHGNRHALRKSHGAYRLEEKSGQKDRDRISTKQSRLAATIAVQRAMR